MSKSNDKCKSNDKSKKIKSSRTKNLPTDLRSLLSKKTKIPLKDSKDGVDSGLEKDLPNEEKLVYKKLRITVEQNTDTKILTDKKRKSQSPRLKEHKRQKINSENVTHLESNKRDPSKHVKKLSELKSEHVKRFGKENSSKFQKNKQNVDQNKNKSVRSSHEVAKSLSPKRKSVSPPRKQSKARSVSPKKKIAKNWQILDPERVSPKSKTPNGSVTSEKMIVKKNFEKFIDYPLKNSCVEEIEILGSPQMTSTPLKSDELLTTFPTQPISDTAKVIKVTEQKKIKKKSDPTLTKFLNAKIADELKKLEEEEPFYGTDKNFSPDKSVVTDSESANKPKKIFLNPNFEASNSIETTHFVLDPEGPIFKGLKTSTDFASVMATKFRDAYIDDNNGEPQNASMLLDAFIVYRATKEEIAYRTLFIHV